MCCGRCAGAYRCVVDGGVRRGQDVVKALALGAHGVLVGRAMVFGATAAGEAGAQRALAILKDELIRTMSLCGTPSLSDIHAELLMPASVRGWLDGFGSPMNMDV